MKGGAFIFGAKYGKGFLPCRKKSGVGWTSPASVCIEGGSFGLQIGGTETDVILLVMNERGAQRLLSSRFTLGGDASVAAGPVGRQATAQTDTCMTAEILSWSRSCGVFAGVSLQGSTLRQDSDDNKSLYGQRIDNKDIVEQEVAPPKAAQNLVSLFTKYSGRKRCVFRVLGGWSPFPPRRCSPSRPRRQAFASPRTTRAPRGYPGAPLTAPGG